MKPPIEYRVTSSLLRPKPKRLSVPAAGTPPAAIQKQMEAAASRSSLLGEFILIKRNRAAYNAYMRDYRKRKKVQK